jgi:hypothetical protein
VTVDSELLVEETRNASKAKIESRGVEQFFRLVGKPGAQAETAHCVRKHPMSAGRQGSKANHWSRKTAQHHLGILYWHLIGWPKGAIPQMLIAPVFPLRYIPLD